MNQHPAMLPGADPFLDPAAVNSPYATAIRASRIPMVICNPRLVDNPVIFANEAFLELTGYPVEEVVGRNCRFLQGPGTERSEVARVKAAIEDGGHVAAELLNYRKDGSTFWNALFISPVRAADGELLYLTGSQIDVTSMRDQERALRAAKAELEQEVARRTRELSDALAAKDVLLHEVDHRVKNNLQLISSLIGLQSRRLRDPALQVALGGMLERVTAMSAVHNQIYRSSDLAHFDLTAFTRELARNVLVASGRSDVGLVLDLQPLTVPAVQASPIALVLNELLTNAIKHGFRGERGGRIRVGLARGDAELVLEVEDDGIGPSGSAVDGGFGSTLVRALAQQLRGRLAWEPRRPGLAARLSLPHETAVDALP